MMPALQINEEYRRLVRPLTAEEYDNLKADIQKVGTIYIPIVINKEGCILDGHHRYLIAEELSIPWNQIPVKTVDFKDKLDEKEYVIKANLNRRQLSMIDKAFLANELHKIEEERKARGTEIKPRIMGDKIKSPKTTDKRKRSTESNRQRRKSTRRSKAATSHGISEESLRKYQRVFSSKYDDLKQQLDHNKTSIDKAHKTMTKRLKDEELLLEAARTNNELDRIVVPEYEEEVKPDLICGDCIIESQNIAENTIDLIFTDPPYDRQSLPLYADLGRIAQRVLKPGGSLITYAGQYVLPDILNMLSESGLTYYWQILVLHTGRQSTMYQKKIDVDCKLLSWYVKGKEAKEDNDIVCDVIESTPPDKTLHEWAQSTKEAEYLIGKLTKPNDIVLDPFMGSGTTGMATLMSDRHFIGIEIDADKFALAKARLSRYGNPRSE